jgi:hypothetical protein
MLSPVSVASQAAAEELAGALRLPFVPEVARALAGAGRYLELVWPQLAPSVETAGFVGSALYMADMALAAVEATYAEYEPVLDRAALLAAGLDEEALAAIGAVLDVFQWGQPQQLLLCAALAEALDAPSVGGQGRAEPRGTTERERAHLATRVAFAAAEQPLLVEVADTLQLAAAPELYRAVACWPVYLAVAWDELQHLAAYPLFRQRGRAIYFYARSSSRFLARPLRAGRAELRAAGLVEDELAAVQAALDAALLQLAMMMMHCCAMRLGLGIATREVVQPS